jgi:hypothetical protein
VLDTTIPATNAHDFRSAQAHVGHHGCGLAGLNPRHRYPPFAAAAISRRLHLKVATDQGGTRARTFFRSRQISVFPETTRPGGQSVSGPAAPATSSCSDPLATTPCTSSLSIRRKRRDRGRQISQRCFGHETVADVGHNPMFETPSAFNALLRSFSPRSRLRDERAPQPIRLGRSAARRIVNPDRCAQLTPVSGASWRATAGPAHHASLRPLSAAHFPSATGGLQRRRSRPVSPSHSAGTTARPR